MITVQKLNDLAKKMKSAPRVENQNRRVAKDEALQKLLPGMKTMHANGYDAEQIAATLADAGLKVSARTVARMLRGKSESRRQAEQGA
ncbi:MAG: hypothetical protein M0Z73_02960 [Betaproteobacteria bacterium]|nr:hypothetical protein [Betaproteobacteria bacterium]